MGLPVPLNRWVACPVVVATVEGQEVGFLATEPCCHPYLVRVHREMDQGALLEREQQIAPVALVLVLVYRMSGALTGQRVLEFGGDDGDAVDRKGHVDDAATVLAVRLLHYRGESNLTSDREQVPGVALRGLRIHGCIRPEIGHAEGLAIAFESMAQDVKRALEFQLLREVVQHGYDRLRPKKRLQRLPLRWLALLQEAGNIGGEEGQHFVISVRAPGPITA